MATKTKKKTELKVVDGTNKDSKRVLVDKEVEVKLSKEERLKIGEENGNLQAEMDDAKDVLQEKTQEFKEFKKPQDLKIKKLQGVLDENNRALHTGKAKRKMQCGVVFNYESNEVITYFPANSNKEADIVERRTMDAKERQLSLIPEEAAAVAAGIPEEGESAIE